MAKDSTNHVCYYPVGAPQRQFGAYVTGAGTEHTNPGEPYPHAYHPSDYYFTWNTGRRLPDGEYQILYIRSGQGIIEFARDKPIPVKAGTLILLHPGEWHRYRPNAETGWEEAYVGIGGTILDRLISPPFFTTKPTIVALPPNGWFDRELLALVDDIRSFCAERPYTLALKTMTLIASVLEHVRTGSVADAHNVAIRKASLHIGHHLAETIDFRELAKQIGMGYSLFRQRFRAYTGLAPLEYQNTLRIRRAAHLIASSDTPIAKIAVETGFQTITYFSRFFHKAMGVSPIQYRKEAARGSRNPSAK